MSKPADITLLAIDAVSELVKRVEKLERQIESLGMISRMLEWAFRGHLVPEETNNDDEKDEAANYLHSEGNPDRPE